MTDDLGKRIASAEIALKEAEDNYGTQHVVVAERLESLAVLLRKNRRTLDAVNLEARAKLIWENNPAEASKRSGVTSDRSSHHPKSTKSGRSERLEKYLSTKSPTERTMILTLLVFACGLFGLAIGTFVLPGLIKTMECLLGLGIVGLVLLIFIAGILFLPTTIAIMHRKRNTIRIFLVNLLLGWTIIGWVIAFIWAAGRDDSQTFVLKNGEPESDMRQCPYCAEFVKSTAVLCKHCRSDLGGQSA